MLPTFIIALREGVEASLIVGIIAAFLGQQGRRDALRWVWIGVSLAIALCLAVGIALRLVGESLPQARQEGMEAVIALVAVAMVTYMIVWMRRHARAIKRTLEGEVAQALLQGSVVALVAAGLVASALHAAHEATWLNLLQVRAVDLSWLVAPGSVRAALLTGMLGLRPEPTVGETLGWLLYLVPVGLYLLWPDRWHTAPRQRAAVASVQGTSR